jgi:hypothetical protein
MDIDILTYRHIDNITYLQTDFQIDNLRKIVYNFA